MGWSIVVRSWTGKREGVFVQTTQMEERAGHCQLGPTHLELGRTHVDPPATQLDVVDVQHRTHLTHQTHLFYFAAEARPDQFRIFKERFERVRSTSVSIFSVGKFDAL